MVERRSPKPNVADSSPAWPVFFLYGDWHNYESNKFFQRISCRVKESCLA